MPMIPGTSKPTLRLQAPKLVEESTHGHPHFPPRAPQALRELSSGTEEGCFPRGSSLDPSPSPSSLPPDPRGRQVFALLPGNGAGAKLAKI